MVEVSSDVFPLGGGIIHLITRRHSLSPTSFTRTPFGLPRGRLTCSSRRDTGLPCSAQMTEWVRSRLFTGSFNAHVHPTQKSVSSYAPFWLKPVSVFGLSHLNGVYQRFTCVDHTIQPSPLSALTLADTTTLSRVWLVFVDGVHCPDSFIPVRCQTRMCR